VGDFYLRREIDSLVRAKVVDWLNSQQRCGWIALTSEPGRGNTSLLQNLERQICSDPNLSLVRARPVLIQACERDPLRPPRQLPPMAMELFDLVERLESTFASRLRLSVADIHLGKVSIAFLAGLVILIVILGGAFATELHNADINLNVLSAEFYWALWKFVPGHWITVAFFLAVASAVSLGTKLFLALWNRSRLKHFSVSPGDDDAQRFAKPESLYSLLHRAAIGVDALVLLVDDLYGNENPAHEHWTLRGFLKDLVSDSPSDPVAKLRLLHRILLVTIECPQTKGSIMHIPKSAVNLDIPAFELAEVAEIARNVLDGETEGQEEASLQAATENINRLFEDRWESVSETVTRSFDPSTDLADHNEFTFADLISLIAFSGRNKLDLREVKRWVKPDPSSELWSALNRIGVDQVRPMTFERLKSCPFVRQVFTVLYVDEPALSAFRRLTAKEEHFQLYGVRALYLWYDFSRRKADERCAWYSYNLTRLADNEAQALRELGISGAAAEALARDIAEIMLSKAGSLLRAGNIDEAKRFAWYSQEWLDLAPRTETGVLRRQMWWILAEVHFLCGGENLWADLSKARVDPLLADDSLLAVYADLENLFRGSPKHIHDSRPAPEWMPEKYRDHLADLMLLDETLWTARTRAGDWWSAFRLPGLTDADMSTPHRPSMARTIYRYFQLMSGILSGDVPKLKGAADAWKEESLRHAPLQTGLVGEALQDWHRAMYLFGVMEIAHCFTPADEGLRLCAAQLGQAPESLDIAVLAHEARRRFSVSSQLFALLGVQRARIHALRTWGFFEWRYPGTRDSWKRIETRWHRCLALEVENHWHYHTPEIFLSAISKAGGAGHRIQPGRSPQILRRGPGRRISSERRVLPPEQASDKPN
jgi:hypothetical protein